MGNGERIRLDRDSRAAGSHDLNRLLDKPDVDLARYENSFFEIKGILEASTQERLIACHPMAVGCDLSWLHRFFTKIRRAGYSNPVGLSSRGFLLKAT